MQYPNLKIDPQDEHFLQEFRWNLSSHGYLRSTGSSKRYLHRLIMCAPRGTQVDHINGDKLDNRRENLRLCPGVENHFNRPKVFGTKHGHEKYKGIYRRNNGKWEARINKQYLGTFGCAEDAARAYNAAALSRFGEFARLNEV